MECRHPNGGELLDRSLWREAFAPGQVPPFPCPACCYSAAPGRLKSEELSRVDRHFRLMMRCDLATCNEAITVVGHVGEWETQVDGESVRHAEALFPAFFYPAPPIMKGSGAQDGYTGLLIEKSSELFWVELEACLNCLRQIIEGTIDNFAVPTTYIDRKGKERRSSLNHRIDAFVDMDEHVAEFFGALRKIGNIGSHGGEISREMVLDAFELLDDCMRHLYDLSPVERCAMQISSQTRIDFHQSQTARIERVNGIKPPAVRQCSSSEDRRDGGMASAACYSNTIAPLRPSSTLVPRSAALHRSPAAVREPPAQGGAFLVPSLALRPD